MNVGGPALEVVAMLRLIDPAKVNQRVLTGEVAAGEADYLQLRAPDIELVKVPGLGRDIKGLGDLRAFLFVVKEIRRFRPHIVHTHTAKAGVLGRVAALATRVPFTVHTFHGHLLHGYFSSRVTSVVVGVEKLLAKCSTRLIAGGEKVRDDLLAVGIGSPEQYSIVAPGVAVPPKHDRTVSRATLGLGPDTLAVVFVARLTKVKRAERFIELAEKSQTVVPNAKFLVLGDGPDREELEESARHLNDRVQFLGWVGDVHSVYAAADMIVLTSDNEGMPLSLIEAAMQGVPAVASDVGSVKEVVKDGISGRLVTPGDSAALLEAFTELATHEQLRQQFGSSAAAHALASFSERRLADDVLAIYLELIAGTDWRN
jgi:glycosyltransferase involved in cell wall biosynthesis